MHILPSLLGLIGLVYLWRYFSTLSQRIAPASFNRVDLVLTISLMAGMIYLSIDGMGQTVSITLEVLLSGILIYLSLAVFILGILLAGKKKLVALFGLRWPGFPRGVLPALLVLVCLYPVLHLIQNAVIQIYGPQQGQQELVHFLRDSPAWKEKSVVIAMVVIWAPLVEEFIFRGVFFGVLRQYIGLWGGLILSSVVFALVHAHIPTLPGLFVLGMVLGAVYHKTGSLWAPIFLHSIFNSVTVLISIFWPEIVVK